VFVVEIPVDGAAEPVRQRSFGVKLELVRQLVGADGVPAIVARPIFDESYELARAAAAGGGAARETGGERLVSREAAIEFVAEETNQIFAISAPPPTL